MQLFENWGLLEADFQSEYGIDLDRERGRSWRWFQVRALGLLSIESRIYRKFAPKEDKPKKPRKGHY